MINKNEDDISPSLLSVSGDSCDKENSSLEEEDVIFLAIVTFSSSCALIGKNTHGDNFESNIEYKHEIILDEVNLYDTFLHSLFTYDIAYDCIKSIPFL